MSGLIDAYLAEFDRHLGFDRRLAQRVKAEVESHIFETIEHDVSEENAIAKFGDPGLLSAAFIEVALPRRAKTTAFVLGLLVVATWALMRMRSSWYELEQGHSAAMSQMAALDRAGFSLGILIASFALWNIYKRRQNIDHAILAINAAVVSFALSIFASIGRATTLTGLDPFVLFTGGLEALGLIAICWNLALTVRHARIVHATRAGE